MFEQTSCSRTLSGKICTEYQRICQGRSVREKSFRANGPIQKKKIKGAFSSNSLLVGTVRPPDSNRVYPAKEDLRKIAEITPPPWHDIITEIIPWELFGGRLSGPVRDTPPIAQYLFEIAWKRGVSHPFALFSCGIAPVSLSSPLAEGGLAPPLRMLSKGESLTQLAMLRHQNPIACNRGA